MKTFTHLIAAAVLAAAGHALAYDPAEAPDAFDADGQPVRALNAAEEGEMELVYRPEPAPQPRYVAIEETGGDERADETDTWGEHANFPQASVELE